MHIIPVILTVLSFVLLVRCQSSSNRLSNATYPIEYKIWLNTQFDTSMSFDGIVEIRIGVHIETDEIQLNAFLVNYNQIELFEIVKNGEENPISVNEEPVYGLLNLRSAQKLQAGTEYTLKISYVGAYQNDRTGLYKSSDTGQKPKIATSFVPQYASRVFPCYDEPTFRAKFTLTIQHSIDYFAISNMMVLKTTPTSGMTQTTFHTTPVMPVHTLAFAVLDYKSNCIKDDELVRICVYYDEFHTAADVELVLETTQNAIVELNNYLGVVLDLTKLDIFPDESNYPDYRSGSYGIFNNNQKYFYFNSDKSGLVYKEEIIRHTIRQVSSLYFGNMLIAEWWDDTWLIQGLSVLFEYIIADKLYPEFDEMNQFLFQLYETGFITQAVKSTDSSTQNPSSLVYFVNLYKSAGILYMFKNIVGEAIFKNGLYTILSDDNSHLINSEMFFNIFTQLAIIGNMIPNHYDFNIIMKTWLTQLRYPMATASRAYIPNTEMRMYQYDIINMYGEDYRTTEWWLPYTCFSQLDSSTAWTRTSPSKWLENISSENIEHGFGTEFDVYTWMICNREQSGFYYMNYDPNNYRLLAKQLYSDHTKITALTRAQLLHVGFITADYDRNSFGLLFELCNYIHREDTYTPVYTFMIGFRKFSYAVYGTEPYENVTKFIANKIGPIYDRIRPNLINTDTNSLSFNDEKLREFIVYTACFNFYQNCLNDTNKLLKEAISDGKIQSLDLSELGIYILHFGMVLADEDLFWKMVAFSCESNDLGTALAFVRDSKLIDELFTILATQNGDKINGIEIKLSTISRAGILGMASANNLPALDKIFQFMIEKTTILKELLGDECQNVVVNLSFATKTIDRLEKLRELVELYKTPTQTFENQLKEAEENVEWCNKRIKEFQQTLIDILDHIDDEDEDDGAVSLSVSIIMVLALIFGVQLFY